MREWLAAHLIAYGWTVRYRHLPPDATPPYPPPTARQLAWSMWLVRTGWALRHGTLLKDWALWWMRQAVLAYHEIVGCRLAALKAAIQRRLSL